MSRPARYHGQIGTMNFGNGMQGIGLPHLQGVRGRGMQDWIEVVNGQMIFHHDDGSTTSGPVGGDRPRVVVTTNGGTPIATGSGSSTAAAIIAAISNIGGGIVNYLNQNNAIKIQQLQYAGQLPGGAAGAANSQGLTGAVAQITNWASANPLLVVAIGAGLFLFLAPSPRSKK